MSFLRNFGSSKDSRVHFEAVLSFLKAPSGFLRQIYPISRTSGIFEATLNFFRSINVNFCHFFAFSRLPGPFLSIYCFFTPVLSSFFCTLSSFQRHLSLFYNSPFNFEGFRTSIISLQIIVGIFQRHSIENTQSIECWNSKSHFRLTFAAFPNPFMIRISLKGWKTVCTHSIEQ